MSNATTTQGSPQALPPALLQNPTDPAMLMAAGRVFFEHAHLDYMLKMIIKTLTGLDIETIRSGLERDGAAELRDKVRRIARKTLKDESDIIRLQALMSRCEQVTRRRNELAHGIWAQHMSDRDWADRKVEPKLFLKGSEWGSAPSVEDVEKLYVDIATLVSEIVQARSSGFLVAPERKQPKQTSDVLERS